jgi:hypothetical protein
MNEDNSNYTVILFFIYVLIFFFAIYGTPISITNNISSSGNSIFRSGFILFGIVILLLYFTVLILFKETPFTSYFQIPFNSYYLIVIFISFFIIFLIVFTLYMNSNEYFENFSPEPVKETPASDKTLPNIKSFPGGTCITNKNKFGYLINNVCVEQNGENIEQATIVEEPSEKKILKTQDNLLKPQDNLLKPQDNNYVGICILPNKKFGYKIPVLGNKCYSQNEFEKYMQTMKKNNVLIKKEDEEKEQKIDIAKENLSKCGLEKNTNFDKYCKEKYGEDFGMKETFKCNDGTYQVQCAKNFANGTLLPNNITSCINKNRDLNIVCTNELIKTNPNILNGGYKKIYKDTCSSGDNYRLVCDENYYDGVPLYINATPCYFQGSNFDRYCKNIYGDNYKLEKIISGNCRVGYLKGICKKV